MSAHVVEVMQCDPVEYAMRYIDKYVASGRDELKAMLGLDTATKPALRQERLVPQPRGLRTRPKYLSNE